MTKNSGGYFGLGRVVSIILAIIPVTAWVCGLIITAQRKHWFYFVLRLIFGFTIIWIVDLISIIVKNKLIYLV